jgi:DNA recombination protein RmuC
MDFWIIALLVIGLVNLGLALLAFTKKSNSDGFGGNDTAAQISLALTQQQLQNLTQIKDALNDNQLRQLQETSQIGEKTERRFGEIQAQLIQKLTDELSKIQILQTQTLADSTTKFEQQSSELRLQFEKLKTDNQAGLQLLQKSVLDQLVQALGQLNETNKQNFDLLSKTNQEKLGLIQGELERKLNENLQQNLKSFEDVTKNLTAIQGTAQRMIESTSSIDKLNSIFERTSSKAFGDFGEKYLESLLEQYLGAQTWKKQVLMPGSSDKIDFVIEIGSRRIGIDSKFPVTKYHDYIVADGDLKKAAQQAFLATVSDMTRDIAAKYYQAEFLDALILYLPSDGMYAEVVSSPKIMEVLQKAKVTPAGPSTIFPLIMLIKEYEFKQNVNQNAEAIIKGLNQIKKNVVSFREEFRKLGDKIRQAQQNYDTADRNLTTVYTTVERLEHKSSDTENLIQPENDNGPELL